MINIQSHQEGYLESLFTYPSLYLRIPSSTTMLRALGRLLLLVPHAHTTSSQLVPVVLEVVEMTVQEEEEEEEEQQ